MVGRLLFCYFASVRPWGYNINVCLDSHCTSHSILISTLNSIPLLNVPTYMHICIFGLLSAFSQVTLYFYDTANLPFSFIHSFSHWFLHTFFPFLFLSLFLLFKISFFTKAPLNISFGFIFVFILLKTSESSSSFDQRLHFLAFFYSASIYT